MSIMRLKAAERYFRYHMDVFEMFFGLLSLDFGQEAEKYPLCDSGRL
jgi:hypothetical protein